MQSAQSTRDWDSMQNARYIQQQTPYQYQQTQHQHTKPLRPSQIKLLNDNSNSHNHNHNHHHYHHIQPHNNNVNNINNINTNTNRRTINNNINFKNNKNLSYHSSPTYSKTTPPPSYPSTSNSTSNAFIRYHSPIEPDTPSFLQLQLNNSMSQISENSLDPNYNQPQQLYSNINRRPRTAKKPNKSVGPVLGSNPQPEIHNVSNEIAVGPYMHKLGLTSNGSNSMSGLFSPESVPSVHSAHSAPSNTDNNINTNKCNQLGYAQPQLQARQRQHVQSKSSFSLPRLCRKKEKKKETKNKIKAQYKAQVQVQKAKTNKKKHNVPINVINFRDTNNNIHTNRRSFEHANFMNHTEIVDDYYHKRPLQRSKTNPNSIGYNTTNRQTYGFMTKVDENLELTPHPQQQQQQQQYTRHNGRNLHHSQSHQQLPHLQHHATYNTMNTPRQIQQQQLRMSLQNNYTQTIQQNNKYHQHQHHSMSPPQPHPSTHRSYEIMPCLHDTNNTQYQRHIPTGTNTNTGTSTTLHNIHINMNTRHNHRHALTDSDSDSSLSDCSDSKDSQDSDNTDYIESDSTSEFETESDTTQYSTVSVSQSQSRSVHSIYNNLNYKQNIKDKHIKSSIHNIYNRWSHEQADMEPKRLIKLHNEYNESHTPHTFSEAANTFYSITPDVTPRHSMLFESPDGINKHMHELVDSDMVMAYDGTISHQSNSKSLSVKKSKSLVKNKSKKKHKKKSNKGTFSRPINQQYSCDLDKPAHLFLISTREYAKTKKSTILLKQALQREILFVGLVDVMINKMVQKMYRIVVPKNECIIRQNEIGDAYFVVEEGKFIIIKKKKVVGTAGAKSAFGEGSLLYSTPRSATLKAKQDSIVWALDAHEFTKIRAKLTAKKAAKSEKKVKFLRKIQLFSKLHIQDIEDISEATKPILYRQGANIITPNDESTHFFIVYKGKCVKKMNKHKNKNKNKSKIIAQYTHCSYFGEDGIINNTVSDYYITAVTDVICYVLNAMEFKKILNAIHMMKINGNTDCNIYNDITHTKFNNICHIKDLNRDLFHIAVIGKGTFGEISLVEDKKTHQTYALKKMRKNRIVDTKQQTQIENERAILCKLNSVFCIKLYATFTDDLNVYLLQEAILGGELFYLLKFNKKFPEKTARFYAGNVILAFEHIHSLNVLYRDLKPEHVLVTQNGYIKLIDYGFSKERDNSCTLCGTPEYLAPEVIQCSHQSFTTDWWTLGIFIYEMIVGYPPFLDDANVKMYEKILSAAPLFPVKNKISRSGIDIITSLLRKHPYKRLGSGLYPFGCQRVKTHAWFNKFDWDKMEKQEIIPPYVPNVKNNKDVSNFQHFEKESVEEVLMKDKDGTLFDWCQQF